jgi:multidrug resistance efflux pump
MRNADVLDLKDCTEFGQAIRSRPPLVVHGAVSLLALMIGAALAWSSLTRVSLVVRAPGRVRPAVSPRKVFVAARGAALSAGVGGQVVEVRAREGDAVTEGAVLIRLETGRLDSDIVRRRHLIQAGEQELNELASLEHTTARQLVAAENKARAELAQVRTDVQRAKAQQEVETRAAQVELDAANDEVQQLHALVNRRAAPRSDLVKAIFKSREAQQKLARARLPVDESRVPVAEQALALLKQDYGLKQEEIRLKRTARQGEIEAARVELADLHLERERAEIRAPISGVVIKGDVKVGDVLEPGKPAMELARPDSFVFEGLVATGDVGHLTVGMATRIKVDAYDYHRYGTLDGTVSFLSPDSDPNQERHQGQVKPGACYTLRVALSTDSVGQGESRGSVKMGMSGIAEVVTGRQSLLSLLVKRIRRTISLG